MSQVQTPTPIFVWPGRTRYEINTGKITIDMSIKIRRIVGEIRAKKSKLNEFPMEPGETFDQWEERISSIDTTIIRREDESVEEHILRLNTPKSDAVDNGLEILNRIGSECFSQPEISEEEWKETRLLKAKNFIFEVLDHADCPALEYAPKRPGK